MTIGRATSKDSDSISMGVEVAVGIPVIVVRGNNEGPRCACECFSLDRCFIGMVRVFDALLTSGVKPFRATNQELLHHSVGTTDELGWGRVGELLLELTDYVPELNGTRIRSNVLWLNELRSTLL